MNLVVRQLENALVLARRQSEARQQAEATLRASEVQFRMLAENAQDLVYRYRLQPTSGFEYVSPSATRMTGYTPEEYYADPQLGFKLVHPEDRQILEEIMESPAEPGKPMVFRWIRKDGSILWFEQHNTPIYDAAGNWVAIEGAGRDITERKHAEETLRSSEGKYRNLFETMIQGVIYQDGEGKIISANPAAERILGSTLDQMQGRTSTDPQWKAIHEDGSAIPGEKHPAMVALQTGCPVNNVVLGVYHPQLQEHRWINITAIPQFRQGEDKPFQVYTIFEDITERRWVEERLKYQSAHDALTDLYSRSYFEEELARLERSRLFPVGIVMIDVDGLKQINDDQGHAAGDELLRRVADILRRSFRPEDMIARIGGDEFCVLLPCTAAQTTHEVLERVRRNLQANNAAAKEYQVSISIGFATADKGEALAEVLKLADTRMYQDKKHGADKPGATE